MFLGIEISHHFNPFESALDDLDFHSFSSGSDSQFHSPFTPENKPTFPTEPIGEVQLNPNQRTNRLKIESPSNPDSNLLLPPDHKIISFGKLDSSYEHYSINSSTSKPEIEESCKGDMMFPSSYSQTKKRTFSRMSRTPLLAQDHVLAERKRREKLGQLFISLAALIPGLKKLDKASVLEDAIKHMKELQGRVKSLEEDNATNSLVSMKRTTLEQYDSNLDCTIPPMDGFGMRLPEIEARVSDKHVLLRIHSEKHRGCIVNIFREIEKLNLTILSHSVLPFGNNIVDITVVAKMDGGFSSTIDDLVRNLRQALINSPNHSF